MDVVNLTRQLGLNKLRPKYIMCGDDMLLAVSNNYYYVLTPKYKILDKYYDVFTTHYSLVKQAKGNKNYIMWPDYYNVYAVKPSQDTPGWKHFLSSWHNYDKFIKACGL